LHAQLSVIKKSTSIWKFLQTSVWKVSTTLPCNRVFFNWLYSFFSWGPHFVL